MPSRNFPWPASEHTKAKHRLLKKYLDAYLPIVLSKFPHAVYIDGFAGPGRYTHGEEGSPIIALRTIVEHQHLRGPNRRGDITMFFIEKDRQHFEMLKEEIRRFLESHNLPPWIDPKEPRHGEFSINVLRILDELKSKGLGDAPRFTFVDPFGYGGTPMSTIERVARGDHSEVLIFFPYPSLVRFLRHPKLAQIITALYATERWMEFAHGLDPEKKRVALVSLYRDQLEAKASLEYTWRFEFRDKRRRRFYLWFGTKNYEGLKQMKAAAWTLAPETGQLWVSPGAPAQLQLFASQADIQKLQRQLQERLRSAGWVPIEDLAKFVVIETDYSDLVHLKNQALRPMEQAKLIEARGRKSRRAGDYPDGVEIRLIE